MRITTKCILGRWDNANCHSIKWNTWCKKENKWNATRFKSWQEKFFSSCFDRSTKFHLFLCSIDFHPQCCMVIWSTSNLLPRLILWQIISSSLNDLLYLFLNCIIDRLIKPHLTEDERGPWEIIWNRFVDIFGEDRYKYYVWGKNHWITIDSTKNSSPRNYENQNIHCLFY